MRGAGEFSLLGSNAGELRLGKNWITAGYFSYRVPFGTTTFYGTIIGADQLITGASPGFANPASLDFHLANGSPCLDRAGALAAGLPAALAAAEEILDPQSSQPRNVLGAALDVGAFEGPGVNLPPVPGTIQFSAPNFTVGEGVGTAAVTATRRGGASGLVTVVRGRLAPHRRRRILSKPMERSRGTSESRDRKPSPSRSSTTRFLKAPKP